MIILPLFFSIYFTYKMEKYWFDFRRINIIFVFITSVFFQSATLYADIQPRRESIVHSHILKNWYYNYKDQLNKPDNKLKNPTVLIVYKKDKTQQIN